MSELIAILDTETTGLRSHDRVIELAVMLLDLATGSVIDARSMLINPCIPIPAEVTEIHGLTDSDVCDKPTLADVWPRVLAFVSGAESHGSHGPVDVVAHNAAFDQRLIAQSLDAHGIAEPSWTWQCSEKIARRVLRGQASYSVTNLARSLRLDGVTAHRAHRALGDVQTLAALLLHMRGVVGKPWGEWCTG